MCKMGPELIQLWDEFGRCVGFLFLKVRVYCRAVGLENYCLVPVIDAALSGLYDVHVVMCDRRSSTFMNCSRCLIHQNWWWYVVLWLTAQVIDSTTVFSDSVGISATGKKCDWQCIDYEVLLPYCRLRCDGLKLCRYIAYCWWNFAVLCCVRRWSFCCWSRSIWSHWRMVECLTHCTAFVMSWRRSSLTPSESISSACECWTGSVVVIVIIISCSFACCHNVNWSRLHWNQPPMFSLVISNTESSQSQPVIQTHRVNWLNLTFSQLAVKMLDLISLLDVFVCDWLALWWLHVTDDKAEHWTLISLQNCNLD